MKGGISAFDAILEASIGPVVTGIKLARCPKNIENTGLLRHRDRPEPNPDIEYSFRFSW
jgi:hypothetical protein